MNSKEVGDLAYILTALALLILGASFLVFTPWWKTWGGRTLGAFLIAVDLIMLWTFLLLTGVISLTDAGIYRLRAVLFGCLCLASWGMLVGFVKAQFFPRGLRSWRPTRRNSREEVR